jgi:hypothetical protein
MATVSMEQKSRMPSCPANFSNLFCWHVVMKAARQIFIKNYRWKKEAWTVFVRAAVEE